MILISERPLEPGWYERALRLIHLDLCGSAEVREPRVSVEASDTVTIPRAELDALKAELRRLRREVGRGVAKRRIHADAGPGDNAPAFTREELAAAWGISE